MFYLNVLYHSRFLKKWCRFTDFLSFIDVIYPMVWVWTDNFNGGIIKLIFFQFSFGQAEVDSREIGEIGLFQFFLLVEWVKWGDPFKWQHSTLKNISESRVWSSILFFATLDTTVILKLFSFFQIRAK